MSHFISSTIAIRRPIKAPTNVPFHLRVRSSGALGLCLVSIEAACRSDAPPWIWRRCGVCTAAALGAGSETAGRRRALDGCSVLAGIRCLGSNSKRRHLFQLPFTLGHRQLLRFGVAIFGDREDLVLGDIASAHRCHPRLRLTLTSHAKVHARDTRRVAAKNEASARHRAMPVAITMASGSAAQRSRSFRPLASSKPRTTPRICVRCLSRSRWLPLGPVVCLQQGSNSR